MPTRMSHAWQTTRKCHLTTYPTCAICGTTERVVVHHLRYRGKRGHSEKPGDLMTLCEYHHDQLHRYLKPAHTSVQGTLNFVAQTRLVEALL